MSVFFAGFLLGLSLIVAIGAQNAFVLKQGIQKQHVLLVCSICALSDAILIGAGVAGFGILVTQFPSIEQIARYAGAAFLTFYGLRSFYSAWRENHALTPQGVVPSSPWRTMSLCLAFTWLNPHVYLDTVVLLGSISTQYEPYKHLFALGAMSASLVFFFSLGFGARLLAPFFRHPRAWKILEVTIGSIMLILAVKLL